MSIPNFSNQEPYMKALLRILKWVLIAGGGLLLIVMTGWILAPDEAIDPGAEAILAKPAVGPADKNGYFLVWGLLASAELDPHETGQKIVAEHGRPRAANNSVDFAKLKKMLGAKPLVVKATRKRCEPEKIKCLPYYQGAQSDYKADIAANSLALERYRALRGYPQYFERVLPAGIDAPLPSYAPAMTLSELVDADIAVKVGAPATRKWALDELAAEIELWRRIGRDSDTLINQMVAVNALHRKFRLASEILRTYPEVVRQHAVKIAAITTPIPLKDLSLERPLQGEFRVFADLYQNLDRMVRASPVGIGLLTGTTEEFRGALLHMGGYRPNASINILYANHLANVQLIRKSPKEMVADREAVVERQRNVNPWTPGAIAYNPVGRALTADSAMNVTPYAFRSVDLIGLSRMVELQRRAIETRAPTGRLPASALADKLTNPYTEQPFDWNVEKSTISFPGFSERFLKDGRMSIDVGSM
jgi:hypothetical protein